MMNQEIWISFIRKNDTVDSMYATHLNKGKEVSGTFYLKFLIFLETHYDTNEKIMDLIKLHQTWGRIGKDPREFPIPGEWMKYVEGGAEPDSPRVSIQEWRHDLHNNPNRCTTYYCHEEVRSPRWRMTRLDPDLEWNVSELDFGVLTDDALANAQDEYWKVTGGYIEACKGRYPGLSKSKDQFH